jgi:hypothetical protein
VYQLLRSAIASVLENDYWGGQNHFNPVFPFVSCLHISPQGISCRLSRSLAYLVKDFSAHGRPDEVAFSNGRAAPHEAVAAVAAGGAGGLYALRQGVALRHPRYSHWISKNVYHTTLVWIGAISSSC